MIKKTITYDDLDGNKKSEDFWFQITKAEFIKKALQEGGEAYLQMLERLSKMSEADMLGQGKQVMNIFETLLRDAVGKREDDLLIKTEAVKNRFMFSGAYDAFFMELIESPDSGAIFLRNILPREAQQDIEKALAERAAQGGVDPLHDNRNATPTPFPKSLEAAVEANQTPELQAAEPQLAETGKEYEPDWYKESRYPTKQELMKMNPDEVAFAMKLKNDKAFG